MLCRPDDGLKLDVIVAVNLNGAVVLCIGVLPFFCRPDTTSSIFIAPGPMLQLQTVASCFMVESHELVRHLQWLFSSWNIGSATPKITLFQDLKKTLLDQSIQKISIKLLRQKYWLPAAWTTVHWVKLFGDVTWKWCTYHRNGNCWTSLLWHGHNLSFNLKIGRSRRINKHHTRGAFSTETQLFFQIFVWNENGSHEPELPVLLF